MILSKSKLRTEVNEVAAGIAGFENTEKAYISSEMKCKLLSPQKAANSFKVSGGYVVLISM